jgi:hypothetical protein
MTTMIKKRVVLAMNLLTHMQTGLTRTDFGRYKLGASGEFRARLSDKEKGGPVLYMF